MSGASHGWAREAAMNPNVHVRRRLAEAEDLTADLML